MQEPTVKARVGRLEPRMEDVEGRVATLETELKDFRAGVQREFASVRAEMREGFARMDWEFFDVRKTMQEGFERARQLTLVLHEALRCDIKTMGEGLPRKDGPQA